MGSKNQKKLILEIQAFHNIVYTKMLATSATSIPKLGLEVEIHFELVMEKN